MESCELVIIVRTGSCEKAIVRNDWFPEWSRCSSESARLSPLWSWVRFLDPTSCELRFVGSLLCFEGFSLGSQVFLPPQKPTLIWSRLCSLARHEVPLYAFDSATLSCVPRNSATRLQGGWLANLNLFILWYTKNWSRGTESLKDIYHYWFPS